MPQTRTAGVFDIRNIIGALLAIYGVVLLGMGLLADPETAKTGGVNANLWAGLALAVAAAAFLAWARLRPVVVRQEPEAPEGVEIPGRHAASGGGPADMPRHAAKDR